MATMNFEQAVIQRSYDLPVVVDFWASWCGPCQVLGPVIEQLAREQQGRWELVKVDTEANPDIAQRYRIMSIPNVKMFYQGEVIGEFQGALPRPSIEKWLNEYLPDERQDELQQLLKQVEQTGKGEAVEKLLGFARANPDYKEASLAAARHLVFSRPEEAKALVKEITMADDLHDQAEDIRVLARFMEYLPEDELPVDKALSTGQEALQRNDLETAIQALIDATTLDKNFRNEMPRRTAIALFRLLGPQHEVTKNYRWKFDMALY